MSLLPHHASAFGKYSQLRCCHWGPDNTALLIAQGAWTWRHLGHGDIWQFCFKSIPSERLAGGGWRACSPFPIYSCPFLHGGSPLPGWSNAQGLFCSLVRGAEPRKFAPGQTAWPCLCFQPDVRWHRWRFYP